MILDHIAQSCPILAISGVAVASLVFVKLVFKVLRGIIAFFVGPAIGLTADMRKAGSWAVVTGSTDGIGKAYARQLAKKKFNIVLISRTQAKLEAIGQEIETEFGVQTRIIAADFTRADIYDTIHRHIAGLDIGVLVNNVGMSYNNPEYFTNISNEIIAGIISCNITSVSMMTRMLLPSMIEKKKGFIINISSNAGSIPVPLLTVYCASKAYVDTFSESLQSELAGTGVIVQCIKPCFVATKMSKMRGNIIAPQPDVFVRSALNTVGIEPVTSGYWVHAIQEFLMDFTPTFFIKRIMDQARSSALRKAAKKKVQD